MEGSWEFRWQDTVDLLHHIDGTGEVEDDLVVAEEVVQGQGEEDLPVEAVPVQEAKVQGEVLVLHLAIMLDQDQEANPDLDLEAKLCRVEGALE